MYSGKIYGNRIVNIIQFFKICVLSFIDPTGTYLKTIVPISTKKTYADQKI